MRVPDGDRSARRLRRQQCIVGAQGDPTGETAIPRSREVVQTGGVDLSPREQVPDRGDTTLTEKGQVGPIPMRCQILDRPAGYERRERIPP